MCKINYHMILKIFSKACKPWPDDKLCDVSYESTMFVYVYLYTYGTFWSTRLYNFCHYWYFSKMCRHIIRHFIWVSTVCLWPIYGRICSNELDELQFLLEALIRGHLIVMSHLCQHIFRKCLSRHKSSWWNTPIIDYILVFYMKIWHFVKLQ